VTHPASYLVLPELTPAAIRAGAARAAETSDETLAVALTLLVSNALGCHPAEHAIRDAWHDHPGAQPEARPAT
jgi:hypothetical protein